MPDTPQRAPRKVLVYRLGSLGDTLIALPALHLIARAFPQAERRMLTNFPVSAKAPPAAAILDETGLIHSFLRYTVGTRSPRDLFKLWWQLVRWHPDVLVYVGSTRGIASAKRDALFFRLCGIFRLIGVPLTQDMQLPRTEGVERGHPILEAEGARLARNLAELGDAHLDSPASWDLKLTRAEHERAAEVLKPCIGRNLIAVSVGTKVQSKDWGRENWHDLLARLAEIYPDSVLALCGAPEESEASEFAAAGWRSRSTSPVVNLCGVLTPRQSAAVFARASVFLGHDSGPMHLAAAVQTPCVAIFAARNIPRVWFPYGSHHRILYHHVDCEGCGLETCILQRKKCITSISVEEVLAQAVSVLSGPSPLVEVR